MPLNDPQKAVASSEARFRVLVAGRRLGKTFLAVRELARFARHPGKRVLYVCPTYQQARDIIWADLKDKLSKLGWIDQTNESRLEIRLVNGSMIILRSGDAGERLRGQGFDFVCFDETSDLSPELWAEVIRPALSAQKPPGSALFCGTPKGIGNWFKDLYDLGKTDPDWASFQYRTIDGGNVPEEEIEAAKRELDARTYKQEYEASFESFGRLIAYNFSEDNIQKWNPIPAKQLLVGCDFNVEPLTAVVYVRTETGLHAIDEIVMSGSHTEELCEEIRNRYPTQQIVVFPDPAGAQRKTSAGGKTDISILQNAGFLVKYKNRHPAVKDRINAMNSLLKNANGDIRYVIDPKCKYLIKSLQRYAYKEGTMVPEKGQWDHMFDAATYAVEYMFPVTREVKPDNTKTFGVW
jgi:hypothetical protein